MLSCSIREKVDEHFGDLVGDLFAHRLLGCLLGSQLRSVPAEDRDTWATVARQTAGAMAAWSNAVEKSPATWRPLLRRCLNRPRPTGGQCGRAWWLATAAA